MATSQKPLDGGPPPYLTFPRFETFITSLKGKALPPRYDRTLVRSMSGAEQSQLSIALRFFRLVEGEDRRFTHPMQKLVGTHGTDAWKSALRGIIEGAYSPIVGDLDKAATMGQLTDAFRDRGGLSGSALAKAIRFYLAAARASDMEISPHFTAPAVPSSSNGERAKRSAPNRGARRQKEGGDAPNGDSDTNGHSGRKLRYTVPSGDIQVWLPDNISLKELDALAKYLKEYVALMEPDNAE